jgi:recombinational DNA repair protein RecR
MCGVCSSLQSCKATRSVTTTSTCTICQDSTKTAATIQTKTVEDYVGVKK